MARQESSILTGTPGRAQTAAVGVLALLAIVQIGLLLRSAFSPGKDLPATLSSQPTPAVSSNPPTPGPFSPPLPGQLANAAAAPDTASDLASGPSAFNPPAPGMLAGDLAPPPSASNPPVATAPAPSRTAPSIDPEVAELLKTVAELRAAGETESILDLLRAAEGMDQNQPAVLHELALTHEQMGLNDVARSYWQRLEMLGTAGAGDLYALARQKLGRTDEVAVIAPPNATPVFPVPTASSGTVRSAPGAALGIGSCQVVQDLTVKDGDRRVLRIPILRTGSATIDPNAVNVDVFFYDLVNGGKVEPTRADPPMFSWMAMPVDWSGLGAEPLDVVYHLPKLTMDEQVRQGLRQYHGYIVKVYYQNRLQATAAEPEDLLNMDLDSSSAEAARSDSAP